MFDLNIRSSEETNQPPIQLSGISKKYGSNQVLEDINLSVKKGEFISIVGPSGCGKSTLFNIIADLTPPDRGHITIANDIGYMQQKDLLLPWKTILDNVVLPLDLKRKDKKESRNKVDEYIDMVGLRGYEHKYPNQLSGGMKQRANFLRTFFSSQEIMLLDEPFGALDAITKSNMQKWLLKIKETLNITILFITHDIDEAIFLSDRIYVLSSKPGRIKKEIDLPFFRDDKEKRLLSNQLLKIKEEIIETL